MAFLNLKGTPLFYVLVAIVIWFVWPVGRYIQIVGLLRRQASKFNTKFIQV